MSGVASVIVVLEILTIWIHVRWRNFRKSVHNVGFRSIEEGIANASATGNAGVVFGVDVASMQGIVERPRCRRRRNLSVKDLLASYFSAIKFFVDTTTRHNNLPVQGNTGVNSLAEGIRIDWCKAARGSRKISL